MGTTVSRDDRPGPAPGEAELHAIFDESRRTGRRMFLRWAGVSVAAAAAAACSETTAPRAVPAPDAATGTTGTTSAGATVDLGSGDIGVLNYAFALEQLEAAFYTEVITHLYRGATDEERRILTDVHRHENIHAKFFRAALGSQGIPDLTVDFSSIDFTSRTSVLTAARNFEDVGVSAYNGAGRLLQNAAYLGAAGKIVSVEARHASAIRDLLRPRTGYFAGDDVVDPTTGLDVFRSPQAVLTIVAPLIKQRINASHLPTGGAY